MSRIVSQTAAVVFVGFIFESVIHLTYPTSQLSVCVIFQLQPAWGFLEVRAYSYIFYLQARDKFNIDCLNRTFNAMKAIKRKL